MTEFIAGFILGVVGGYALSVYTWPFVKRVYDAARGGTPS